MIRLQAVISIAATTADSFYIAVPCRGIVKNVRYVYNQETDKDETCTLSRGSDAVNVVTPPSDGLAEGTMIEGTPDSTNADLIFDPDSSTTTHQVIKVAVPNTFDTAGQASLSIDYDDSAAVTEDPSEA